MHFSTRFNLEDEFNSASTQFYSKIREILTSERR
jgi:hypothetical protein